MHSPFHFPPESVEYRPEEYLDPIPLHAFFPKRPDAPLEVDLGCGDGTFLTALAAQHPEHNFLGIERLLGRVRRCCRKAARTGLSNVRLLRIESSYGLRYLLPPGCISVLHILFPDPWPKRRHEGNRLIQTPFLETAHRALAPGGELHLATDNAPYFAQMEAVCLPCPLFTRVEWTPPPHFPQTDFEQHYRAEGVPINRLRLRKVEPS